MLLIILALFASTGAYAFTLAVNDDGSVGWAVADFIVRDLAGGPIGFVAAAISALAGLAMLLRGSWVFAVVGLLTGSVLFNLENIVTSLGMVM